MGNMKTSSMIMGMKGTEPHIEDEIIRLIEDKKLPAINGKTENEAVII